MAVASRSPSRRVASLLSSATEILFALGLGESVVGVSHECDWPPIATSLPRLTRSHIDSHQSSLAIDEQVKQNLTAGLPLYGVDADRLRSLAPDLIITQAQCDVCAVRYADVLDVVQTFPPGQQPSVLALQPNSLDEILQDILRVGEATDTVTAARQYLESLQQRIETITTKTTELPEQLRPRVACIEWVEPLMLAGNWTPELIRLAGGESLLARSGKHSGYHTWEDVIQCKPDVVVIAPCGFPLERSREEALALSRRPGWNDLAAVKHERVFVVDGNAYLNRSGPRIIDSLEILAHVLHPDLIPAPSCGGWERLAA